MSTDSRNDEVQLPRCWSSEEVDPAATRTSLGFLAPPCFLALAVIILCGLSLNMVYSATIAEHGSRFLNMQIIWMLVGIAAAAAGTYLPLEKLYRYSLVGVIIIAVPLLYLILARFALKFDLFNLFPFAHASKGAVRWLRFGSVQIQPSEFAKPMLLIFLAAYYGRMNREKIKGFTLGVIVPGAMAGMIVAGIIFGKDLSTSVITAVTTGGIMLLAGVRMRHLMLLLMVGAVIFTLFITTSQMRMRRMTAYWEPEKHKQDESYQLYRSLLCLGGGGLTGVGYSQGVMKSYLPECHTDFIVSVIGEELGAVGVLGVIAAYVTIAACIIGVARHCRRRDDMLLCMGVAILIFFQAFINISVVSGMCPPTGVTAPFLSYGGSSIMSLAFMIGLIFNVHRRNYNAIMDEIYYQRFTSVG